MRSCVCGVLLVVLAGVLGAPPAEAARRAKPYDFDGNGHPDLVVGAPGLLVNGQHAGGVVVLMADEHGLSTEEQVFTQSSRGVPGASEEGDRFGEAVASADFNRDGYADLAVGQPGESSAAGDQVGAVTVIFGSQSGLSTRHSHRVAAPKDAPAEAGFGTALATGDLDGDGYPDLAVGAPGPYGFGPTGTVTLVKGGRRGLSSHPRLLHGRTGEDDGDSGFGAQLAVGDLDQDGRTDLVVASRGVYDGGDDPLPGAVSYCLGRSKGVEKCTRLLQDTDLTLVGPLAVANVVGSSRPEIVIGTPDPSLQHYESTGVLVVQLEGRRPLRRAGASLLGYPSVGLPDAERWEGLGRSFVLGDVDADGYADLVAGVPGASEGRGQATLVHGGKKGWQLAENLTLTEDTPGVPGVAEAGDVFGSSMTLLDHDRDGHLDLTVGAPGEDGSGSVTTLHGVGGGVTTAGARTTTLASLGYASPSQARFGESLGKR